jgi:hypothetical protein
VVYGILRPNYDFATKSQEGRDFFYVVSTLYTVFTGPLFSAGWREGLLDMETNTSAHPQIGATLVLSDAAV